MHGKETLLQQAAGRLTAPGLFEPLHILAHEEHRFIIAEQLRSIGTKDAQLILEPVGRNTGPAAAVAALRVHEIDPEAVLLLCPADHLIQDHASFQDCVRRGIGAAHAGKLILFGVKPTAPEAGYGYIRTSGEEPNHTGVLSVSSFVEKPDATKAQTF